MAIPILRQRQVRDADPLLVLRRVFLSFCFAIAGIMVVLGFMDFSNRGDSISAPVAATIAAICGVIALVARAPFANRTLDCTNAQSLSSSFRTRFFLCLACSEAPALVGFALVFLSRTLWPYVTGAVFTAIGFALTAPTRRRLQQDQRRLKASGCTRNLTAALRGLEQE